MESTLKVSLETKHAKSNKYHTFWRDVWRRQILHRLWLTHEIQQILQIRENALILQPILNGDWHRLQSDIIHHNAPQKHAQIHMHAHTRHTVAVRPACAVPVEFQHVFPVQFDTTTSLRGPRRVISLWLQMGRLLCVFLSTNELLALVTGQFRPSHEHLFIMVDPHHEKRIPHQLSHLQCCRRHILNQLSLDIHEWLHQKRDGRP